MKINRRNFLIIGGVGVLGMGLYRPRRVWAEKCRPPGKPAAKWALAVDLKKCWAGQQAGCRDCIDACNQAHNIPQIKDAKEEIKWIWLAPFRKVLPDQDHEFLPENIKENSVVTLCNHCENRPVSGCVPPRPLFKIRRNSGYGLPPLYRCRYCMAACPYGARSFNFRDPRPFIPQPEMTYPTREKGVVEKCNFCTERLEDGLLPICVEVCSYGALIFGDLSDSQSELRKILRERYSLQRKPQLGTEPKVYYLI